jgi:hypothetical protein
METMLLVLGIIFFIGWISGLFISVPAMWRKIIGDPQLKHKLKRSLPVQRRKRAF